MSLINTLIFGLPIAGFANSNPTSMVQALLPEENQILPPLASSKRKLDFANGRACARAALEKLGIRDFPILKGKEGNPIWPRQCVGSISHTNGMAGAIVAQKNEMAILGLDIERRDNLIETALAKIICHPSELESLPSFAISKTSLLNLYFSARESVFKAVYAYNAHRLNYQDIRIELDLRQQKFYIHFDKLAFPIPLAGRFVFSEHHVATLVFRNHWASERNPS